MGENMKSIKLTAPEAGLITSALAAYYADQCAAVAECGDAIEDIRPQIERLARRFADELKD